MSRPVHFEIHVDDLDRAMAFYAAAFGWSYEDWSEFAGLPYAGVTTGEEGTLGINGALMQRQGPSPGGRRRGQGRRADHGRRGLRRVRAAYP